MKKSDNPVILAMLLAVTFGVCVGGIWSAYHFGFGFNSGITEKSEGETQNVSDFTDDNPVPTQKLTSSTPKPTPITTATPKPQKTADDANKIQAKIKFAADSPEVSTGSSEVIDRLAKEISQYDPNNFAIKIIPNYGDTDFSRSLAQQRGSEVAGYLRDRGLRHKIIISSKGSTAPAKNLSQEQKRDLPLEIRLVSRQ